MDGQTYNDSIYRISIALHGKNISIVLKAQNMKQKLANFL